MPQEHHLRFFLYFCTGNAVNTVMACLLCKCNQDNKNKLK